jgi:hypothetical protein
MDHRIGHRIRLLKVLVMTVDLSRDSGIPANSMQEQACEGRGRAPLQPSAGGHGGSVPSVVCWLYRIPPTPG